MQALLFSGWWKMASSLRHIQHGRWIEIESMSVAVDVSHSHDAKDFTLFNPLWVNKQQHAQHAQQPMDVHDAHKRPT
eukprot:scaffold17327_cov21-Tisochrysis_lutea.AAC.3